MTTTGGETSAGRHFNYDTQWPAYALAWSSRDTKFRLAVGSCLENEMNHIQIIEMNEETKRLECLASAEHTFPPTKLMWRPDHGSDGNGGPASPDLLASSSTTMHVWKVQDGQVKCVAKLANTRTQKQPSQNLPPLTSFDWSTVSHHKLGASSVDTTCTIWNLERQKIETQLIAHDKAVYDIAFSQVDSLFASVGADGSVRLFDQRNLDHSTIVFEASPPAPLLRLAWNKNNTNHIACIAMDAVGVHLIDIRRPSVALAALSHHDACVNSISWAPHSRNHLLCGTDDGYGIIWDVAEVLPSADPAARSRQPPLLAYDCGSEVYQAQWSPAQPDYFALGMANQVRVLPV
eukprot:TRINITY_DN96634_c0_g1_i1.p1 TRINITY_DN96634_c0_g1~~TRINITY_DN96634_c0_g1_i1.p1  ORF type:complete len:348 (+),score=62.08 TRINITY_DN96634_c0_g1_i1:118-1161(+)